MASVTSNPTVVAPWQAAAGPVPFVLSLRAAGSTCASTNCGTTASCSISSSGATSRFATSKPYWRPMGGSPAAPDHGCVHSFLWPSRQAALQWPPLSRFLFRRARSLDLFLHCAPKLHQRRRRQSARHHQSVFPTSRPPIFCRRFWSGGLRHRLRRSPCGHLLSTALSPRSPCFGYLLLLLAVLTALGVGLWMSALNALYRDVRYVVPFLVQFWMFASPVAYPSSLVPNAGAGSTVSIPWRA